MIFQIDYKKGFQILEAFFMLLAMAKYKIFLVFYCLKYKFVLYFYKKRNKKK